MRQSIKLCEQEAALKIALYLRQEFGLSPTGTAAALADDVLKVTLYDALTPIGRLVSHDDHGPEILRSTYHLLHQHCRKQLHLRATRITGRSVVQSRLEVDPERGDITMVFLLSRLWNSTSLEGYHA